VRDLVLGALDRAGGEDYLVQQAQTNPTAFLTLVGKCISLDRFAEMDPATTVVTNRHERTRVISLRRANRREQQKYAKATRTT